MRISKTKIMGGLLAAALAIVGLGCGSATNNDQGVVFQLIGFFADATGSTGDAGRPIPLTELTDVQDSSDGGRVLTFLGLQNALSGQFIVAERAFMSYVVAGGSIQPPDTNQPLNTTIGPSPGGVSEVPSGGLVTDGSSLPGCYSGDSCTKAFAQTPIVPAQIREWLAFHKTELPETPFDLEVIVSVRGRTSAGDILTTNPMTYRISVVSDVVINPPAPNNDGAAGGATDGFVDEGSEEEIFE